MNRDNRSCRWLILVIITLLANALAHAEAYYNLTALQSSVLSNGVQLMVKADGLLTWNWEPNSQEAANGKQVTSVSIRFPSARLGNMKTLYDLGQDPISTAALLVPQDARNGLGVVLQITMTQPSNVQATLSEDRQTFLLTVKGERTVEKVTRNSDAGAMKEGALQVTAKGKHISVRAVKANIHQVVSEIARQGGINAAVDDAVRRDVSLNLQDCDPLAVLSGIAAGYGLALAPVGDLYMLCEGVPTDISTYQRSKTSSFAMKYLKAGDARSLLPSFLFKYVHENPEQNAVVVTAPSQMLDKIGQDLQTVDIPAPMILVECAVIELTDSADFDAAFRWRYQDNHFDFGADSTTGEVNYRMVGLENGLTGAIVPTPLLQVTLQNLLTRGRAKVEAHPSMAAVNGKSAEIFIGSQRFIKVSTIQNGQTQERLETVPVGVRLSIRPSTGGNNEITSWMKVEVSNIVQIDPQSGVPLLGTRRAETTMRTHDGDTIIIGGLSLRQEDETKRRIPLLGRLPLIGGLFRSTAKSNNKTELVLLLRPRLLDEHGGLPTAEDQELRNRFLQPQDLGYPGNPPATVQPAATGKL